MAYAGRFLITKVLIYGQKGSDRPPLRPSAIYKARYIIYAFGAKMPYVLLFICTPPS
jgi:hypothetical protein